MSHRTGLALYSASVQVPKVQPERGFGLILPLDFKSMSRAKLSQDNRENQLALNVGDVVWV